MAIEKCMMRETDEEITRRQTLGCAVGGCALSGADLVTYATANGNQAVIDGIKANAGPGCVIGQAQG